MQISELLPIGSVVRLREGEKNLMIIGVFQTNPKTNHSFDYLSVIYPEGYLGKGSLILFQHSDIEEVIFVGHRDSQRDDFIGKLEEFYGSIKEKLGDEQV